MNEVFGRSGSWRKVHPRDLEQAGDANGLADVLTSSAPTATRVAAAEALSRLGGLESTLALAGGLQDDTPEVREASADALADIGGPRAMDALLGVLDSRDPVLKGLALRHLVTAQETRVVPRLVEIVLSPGNPMRRAAIGALGGFPGPESRRALLMAIQDPTPQVADMAALALGKLGGAEAISHLLRLRSPPALRALGTIGHPAAVDGLLQTLGNPRDSSVRAAAADALMALDRRHPRLQLHSIATTAGEVEALARCGDVRAAVPLCRWLFAPDATDRARACMGLARLGDRSVVSTLEALISDPVPEVCRAAADAILELDPERDRDPLGETIAAHLDRIERLAPAPRTSDDLLASIDFLARLGATYALPTMRGLEHHPDPTVRRAATLAVRSLAGR